jgi:NitT/TauT family transport system substrate-binding protein/putative hydroxymethylpyrimidine transport system substrate-binding protein
MVLAGCGGDAAEERPTVRVALDFTPNAAHAPIYAAAAGRTTASGEAPRIEIRQPSSSSDSLKLLASGRADLAVVDIHDLGLAREKGADVVGVAALVRRPLAAVIAGPGVRRPRDLEGKRVGVTGLPSDDAVLRSVVEGDGGRLERVRRVTIGFSAVPSLVSKKVAAATAFWNVEGVALRARGVRTREFRVDEFGAPRYPELVLVTRRATLSERRELVRDALFALAEGAAAARNDPAPTLGAIARAAQAEPAAIRAQYDAIRPALAPPLRLEKAALMEWARFDVRFGILERAPDLDRAFDFSAAP